MSTPPSKKTTQKDYVHSAVRLPPALLQEIKEAALRQGRSMNAEIIARLTASDNRMILEELAELKLLVKRLFDK